LNVTRIPSGMKGNAMARYIDIHLHALMPYGPPCDEKPFLSTAEQLISRMDEIGIEMGVLLPLVSPEAMTLVQRTEEILEISRTHEGRFIPFCNIDPRMMGNRCDAPFDTKLAGYVERGCRGIGEVTANLPVLDPLMQNLFKHVNEFKLPLTFHIAPQRGSLYGMIDEPGLPGLERSLARFPDIKFLGHSQAFWAEIARLETPAERYRYPEGGVREEGVVPKMMRRYDNLYGDLSAGSGHNALARDRDYAGKFLNEFQDRLLFGTDICRPDTPTPLVGLLDELLAEKRIPQEVFEKVAWKNAAGLLGIEEEAGRFSRY
jgi:uncharacterized protein